MNYDLHIQRYLGKWLQDYGSQCVSNAAHYCIDNSKPIAYANACNWWQHPALTGSFDFVTNNPSDFNQVPQRGQIIIWNSATPGSYGAGHIAIFDRVVSPGVFVSFDANWGGATCHFVTHNWGNVVGWMVPKVINTPQGGSEVANAEQVKNIYRAVLHREGDPGGIAHYTGKDANFIVADMLSGQERKNLDARINGQSDQLTALQNAINEQNRVITELNTSGTATKAQLTDAIAKLADLNAQLATATDTIKDLQNNPDTELLNQGKGVFAWITKLLNRLKG